MTVGVFDMFTKTLCGGYIDIEGEEENCTLWISFRYEDILNGYITGRVFSHS